MTRASKAGITIWLLYWVVGVSWIGVVEAFGTEEFTTLDAIGITILYGLFVTVGALVVARVPGNIVGWILCVAGLGSHLGNLLTAIAEETISAPNANLGLRLIAWAGHWIWPLSVISLLLLLFFFPTGRRLEGRLGLLPLFGFAAVGLFALVFLFKTGPLEIDAPVDNPLGVPALDGVMGVIETAAFVSFLLALASALLTVVVRTVRSSGVERQQMKWFAFSAAVMAAGNFLLNPLLDRWVSSRISDYFFLFFLGLIPIGTGIAVLRFRLYDIDVIISKTLSYAALTAILLGCYLGSVLLLQAALASIAADSDIAVAASTLGVAALFGPLRRRVQLAIDRRFYRRRYDSARAISSMVQRFRDEIEIETISRDVVGVLGETLQPTHASVWLVAR